MKRIQGLFILLITAASLNAQSYTYAWLTDLHIGSPGADIDLSAVINDINTRNSVSFAVITGDITEKGKDDELDKAKSILDKLNVPFYIVEGNHDLKWSESAGTRFSDFFGNRHFIFKQGNQVHAGVSSGIIFRGGGGHVSPEELSWLKDSLRAIQPEGTFLYLHHPLDDETDNWFKVINILRESNPEMIFLGHGHANRILSSSGIPSLMSRSVLKGNTNAGYNLVQVEKDSLFCSEVIPGGSISKWYSGIISVNDVPEIDSLQFINYTGREIVKKDFGVTVSAPLEAADGRIFIATYKDGIICTDYQGKELWRYNAGGTIVSKPVFSDGILVCGTAEGDLIGLEAHTGKIIQVIGLGEPVTSQLIVTEVMYGNDKTRGIIAGTAKGNLYCYDLYTFEMIWENNSAKGMIETKPLIINDRIIYGSWDNYLYCINAASGVLNWRWTENKNFYYSPAACWPVTDGKNVYVCTPDKYVSAIDLLLGATAWRKNIFDAWETIQLSSDNSRLYIKGLEDDFYIVSPKDAKLIKKLEIKFGTDTTPSPPVENKQNIFFGSKNGILYSIDKTKYEWKPEVFLGTARIHSVILLDAGRLAAINMDGTLAIIKL